MITPLSITPSAAERIKLIIAKEGKGASMLRVGVEGGGCSGFSYTFGFASQTNDDDVVIETNGAKVVVDEVSIPFLEGSELDYVTEVIGSAFKIKNPNATAACGCGTSFSV